MQPVLANVGNSDPMIARACTTSGHLRRGIVHIGAVSRFGLPPVFGSIDGLARNITHRVVGVCGDRLEPARECQRIPAIEQSVVSNGEIGLVPHRRCHLTAKADPAHGSGRIRCGVRASRNRREAMTCGVLRIAVCLVEVPDADVVCPYIFRLLGRSRPVAVIHEDLRVPGRRGKLHPDERFPVRVPGFDLVRHGNAVLVDEHHVSAICEGEVVIVKTRDCRLTELDERRDSRRYLRRRQIGGKRNFDIFLEVRKRRGRSLESICRSGNATWPDSRRVGAGLDRRCRGDCDRTSVERT